MKDFTADIDHLADLAKLGLTQEERAVFGPQMASILEYVGKLAKVNTTNTTNRTHVSDAINVWREDVMEGCGADITSHCLEAFPKKVGTALSVPGVFEGRG